MTLRTRVAVAAALAILLAIGVLGTAVDVIVSRQLHRSLDRTLRARAAEVSRLSLSAPALLTTPGALEAPLGGRQLSVEVLDRRGRIVARSFALGGRVLPEGRLVRAAIRRNRTGYGGASVGGERVRVYVAPLPELAGTAGGGAVIVASPTSEIESTLSRLRAALALSAVAAAALAALAVAYLTRRALRPLERLSRAAEEIERTGDPRRRLPTAGTADEVGRLGVTLNAMLAALERAREAERRFVADASHELRTPLTALRGNAAYVASHGADATVLADLEHDAARLSRLLDDLLALSREDAAGPPQEDVRLDELARSAAEDDADVDVDAPAPVSVRGDRDALSRALANLIQNAHRYGPAGGRIRVAVASEDGIARLSVADEGAGLQPYEAERAFERFWRGRRGPRADGSGLGLAIVRATAERHGGRASAVGSRFTIELPALTDLSGSAGTTSFESREKGHP